VFKLGTKYTVALDCNFDDETEARKPVIMGCYGIGVNRIVASLAETKHDENGLLFPLSIAPFELLLVPVSVSDEETMSVANRFYQELKGRGVDVLLDDRDQRPGVKFKDGDLIGIPLRVVIGGKGLKEGVVELKWRNEAEASKLAVDSAIEAILQQIAARKQAELAKVPV
jgi:prolyl-tRNA synthetase